MQFYPLLSPSHTEGCFVNCDNLLSHRFFYFLQLILMDTLMCDLIFAFLKKNKMQYQKFTYI